MLGRVNNKYCAMNEMEAETVAWKMYNIQTEIGGQ
jgi:hypothetical protein